MSQGGTHENAARGSAAVAVVTGAISAAAQTYPNKSITIIVPFAAGGPSDALARIMGERMKATLGQSFVVENVTGAAGSIAVGRAVRAAPDGYTISFGHLGTHVANGAIYPLPYDMLTDLEPVVLLPSNPMVVVSKTALPAKNLKELIAWLKANQDKATAGTAGAGSGSHIAGVYLAEPHRAAPAIRALSRHRAGLNDLVGGQIDIIVDQASNSMQQIRAGRIRAYAISDSKRLKAAPEIPTAEEAGLPGFHMTLWNGLWVPKGTPKDVDRTAERGGGRSDGRSGGAEAPQRSRPRSAGARSADAAGARAPGTRPRSTSGGRSSRRPASSRNSAHGVARAGRPASRSR